MLPPMVVILQRNAASRQPLTEMILVLLGLSLPLALGTSLLAPQVLSLVFSAKFAPAAPTLSLLIWTAPFSFVNVAYLLFLSTRKQQHRWVLLVLIGIVITTFGLSILIPIFGSAGAAMARLVGEAGVCLLGTWNMRKSIDYPRLISGTARIAVALVGLIVVVLLSLSAPIVISIVLGAALYGLLIVVFGPWPLRFWRTVLSL
jgi:O-antigen/teichoic acid export membrane protein